jgi:hypothetical protein
MASGVRPKTKWNAEASDSRVPGTSSKRRWNRTILESSSRYARSCSSNSHDVQVTTASVYSGNVRAKNTRRLGDVQSKHWIAAAKSVPELGLGCVVVPEQWPSRTCQQVIWRELQTADAKQTAAEVQADPPLRVQSSVACALAIEANVTSEVSSGVQRNVFGNAARLMPPADVTNRADEHDDPEAPGGRAEL